ncbi:MAG: signal peptidase I [Propionibacteriaceae bacterium]|jgi:signal peptidase|nr:signal peptidase I [Propionibacteriaceae bacterium]
MRAFRVIQTIALTITAIIGAASIAAVGVAVATDMKPVVVISGSMEPELPVGSLVLGRPVPASELKPGDVVTLERPHDRSFVTHRIVSVAPTADGVSLVLKGDANKQNDPEAYTVNQANLVVAHVPYAGTALLWMRSHAFAALAILAALLAISLWPTPHRYKVILADGTVKKGLSKREADECLAEMRHAGPQSSDTASEAGESDDLAQVGGTPNTLDTNPDESHTNSIRYRATRAARPDFMSVESGSTIAGYPMAPPVA